MYLIRLYGVYVYYVHVYSRFSFLCTPLLIYSLILLTTNRPTYLTEMGGGT
jgi:hypothetical protein